MSSATESAEIPFKLRQRAVIQVLTDLRQLPGTGDTLLLLIGAHAAATHIRQFRSTKDIDFLMSFRGDITPLGKALSDTFPGRYTFQGGEISLVMGNDDIIPVDIITFGSFVDRFPVLENCRRLSQVQNTRQVVASIPDLILLKMSALLDGDRTPTKRSDDITDILTFISLAQSSNMPLPTTYPKWIFRQLKVNEGQLREVSDALWGLIPYGKDDEVSEGEDEEEYDDSDIDI